MPYEGVRSTAYLECLVVCATDQVAMADIVRPGDFGVRLARKGVAFQSGQFSEVTTEAGGCERSEVASNTAFALNYDVVSMLP